MWLSIRLPQLPLESVLLQQQMTKIVNESSQRVSDINVPCAIIEANQVCCINEPAYQQGVRLEQSVTSAFALCDHLKIIERNIHLEEQLLQHLALILYEISSSIQIHSPIFSKKQKTQDAILVIEIARSLKLYKGISGVIEAVIWRLDNEKIKYHLGIGHSEKAARLLSLFSLKKSYALVIKDEDGSEQLDTQKLDLALFELPIELAELDSKIIEKTLSVGIKTIGKLDILGAKRISKRFGQSTTSYLMQLFNRVPSPIDFYHPPENFYHKMNFLEVIHHQHGLAYPIKYLSQKLTQFLRLKQKNCQSLLWEVFDTEKNVIGFEVLISESQICERVYTELTQLNLARYTLHAPIEAIALTANQLVNFNSESKSLFSQSESFKRSTHFINKIRAKLGHESCYQLSYQSTHVPEFASNQVEVNSLEEVKMQKPLNHSSVNELNLSSYASASLALDINQQPDRPAWLMEKPKPIQYNQRKLIWQGELQIISSQEKVTSYWWKKSIARDYFLAEHDDGTIYWVFYDQMKKQWFLHGIYG